MPHRVIDLFAGCGGMTRGFKDSGSFEPVQAVEFDPDAAETYGHNFGDEHVEPLSIDRVRNFAAAEVIVGGPPCQGFSRLNKWREETPSRQLWREYLRVVGTVRPAVFVMENVPQLLDSPEFADFRRHAEGLEYVIRTGVLNAADFGVPQRRRRAIAIGALGVRDTSEVPWPVATHGAAGLPPWKTVREAFAEIPREPDGLLWHRPRRPRPMSLVRYSHVPADGGNRHQMRVSLDAMGLDDYVPRCWREHSTGNHDVFGRMWWDRPAPTIRTEFFKPEKGRYLHPEEDRAITIREGAALQSLEDII
ncbi:DNA cytosine methyltransferase, partial [bacterium]